MANIQIIGEIDQVSQKSRYSDQDLLLLQSTDISSNFYAYEDYIEYHILDSNNNLISSDYNYNNYKLSPSVSIDPSNNGLPILEIDPLSDLENTGYNSGEFNTQYNFFKNRLSDTSAGLYIQEISSDRTELRLASPTIDAGIITGSIQTLISQINDSTYYQDFLLNFGSNQQYLITNLALDLTTPDNPTILVKLYIPLLSTFTTKTSLWIVEEIIDAYIFNINLSKFIIPDSIPTLRGANFDIDIQQRNNKSTSYENYNSLLLENNLSKNQIINYLNQKGIQLNIDYSDYSQFTHFGSVTAKITNFYSKIKQIEELNNFISASNLLTGSTPNLINDISSSNSNINNLIIGFDSYENYLYFQSGSIQYPKVNNNLPYKLQATSSAESINWYNNSINSSSLYDQQNLDNLENTIPDYVREDENNQPYITFINMIGHYFDSIWIYLDAIDNIWENTNNNIEGISKDVVYYMLQSLGVNLYNNESEDLSTYLLGANSGSINSTTNTSDKDLLEETYKRLYHNLPYLSKAKGTIPGLRALITCFGIPSNILDINEYGGNNKIHNFEVSPISNNKVRIIDNNISSSVLSNFIKIEDTPDSLLVEDLPYIDVAFNPNKSLNENIITNLSSSFNIDDYIGNPLNEFSSSYNGLKAIQITNYGTYLTNFPYKKYIDLVSIFDNSLFKMIQDFIPGRANPSIGIMIESPILERNKIKRYSPKFDNEQVFNANYNKPIISEDNSYFYNLISGQRLPFYTGEITGSYLNIYADFEKTNQNPYLNHTESYSQSEFNHSEFNILLNNVSQSILSSKRKTLEPVYSPDGLIIGEISRSYAELQDSYLGLQSYKLSRYLGSKLYSLEYNNYTSASGNYLGDISYGKTAVIDQTVLKLGLLTKVTESLYLKNKNNVTIKYLVNSSGSLTELNLRNTHWQEVQNTFKAGDSLVVSLFDNQKYSNQRSTDGNKVIFNSGYSYYPTMYFSGEDSEIVFDFSSDNKPNQFKAVTIPKPINNTSSNYHYQDVGDGVNYSLYDIFNNTSPDVGGYNDNDNYVLGTTSNPPYYIVPQEGVYSFESQLQFQATAISASQTINVKLQISSSDGQLSGSDYISSGVFTSASGSNIASTYGSSTPPLPPGYTFSGTALATVLTQPIDVYNAYNNMFIGTYNGADVTFTQQIYTNGLDEIRQYWQSNITLFGGTIFKEPIQNSNNYTTNFNLNIIVPAKTYSTGDKITFAVSASNLTNYQLTAQNGYAMSSLQGGQPVISGSLITNIGNNTISLNPLFASFLNDYIYLPSGSATYPGSQSSLYNKYGDIDYNFTIDDGDIIKITDTNNVDYEFNVLGYNISGSLNILSSNVPSNLSPSNIEEFIILKKVEDETNIIITYNKKPGATSLGFILPSNLNSDVLSNIDTITTNVKNKLIDLGL